MKTLTIWIDDRVRERQVQQEVNAEAPIDLVLDQIIRLWGLPRRDFDLTPIVYALHLAGEAEPLPNHISLHQAGVERGDTLELVSPRGRRVWRLVNQLLEEIEDQVLDRATGQVKERLVDEAWEWVTQQLAEIEKTRLGGDRVDRLRRWVEQVGGPNRVLDVVEKARQAPRPLPGGLPGTGIGLLSKALIGAVAALVVVGAAYAASEEQPLDALWSYFQPDVPSLQVTQRIDQGADVPQPAPEATSEISPTPIPTPTRTPTLSPEERDRDQDGLSDAQEQDLGTDPTRPDTDSDGLTDGEEFHSFGTDPLNPDSDADGLSDGQGELARVRQRFGGEADPLNPDTDSDGRNDGDEVRAGTNPLDPQDPPPDRDGDGLIDREERRYGSDPLDPDSDGDRLSDGEEVHTLGTRPDNPDTDGDTFSDGEEVNQGSDPLDPEDPPRDQDGDGLLDRDEARLGTDPHNPDSDPDGLLDGEEVYHFGTRPLDPDSDDDGLSDGHGERDQVRAAFGGEADPKNPDTDGDGHLDGDELKNGFNPLDSHDPPRDRDKDGLSNETERRIGTNPKAPDSDGDGLLDGTEVNQTKTDPLQSDTDGDGFGDGREVKQGSNPLDPFDPQRPDDLSGFKVLREASDQLTFQVDYGYFSNHGNKVQVGARVLYKGRVLPIFVVTPATIAAGSGTARVHIQLGVPAALRFVDSEQVEVVLYTQGGSEFYKEIFDHPRRWASTAGSQPPSHLSPPDGSVFNHFPRTTTLKWNAVPGAENYTVEIDCYHCCAINQWCTDVGKTWDIVPGVGQTSYTFDFVGAQPGRWRVWARFPDGTEGPSSSWWGFEYTR